MLLEKLKKKFLNLEVSRKQFFLLGLFPLIFLSYGCSYKFGVLRSQEGRLHLVVQNDSLAPQLGPIVDQEIRKAFISFHQYELVNDASRADYHLRVILKSYQSRPESYQREDALYASGFGMQITALMSFTSKKDVSTIELTTDATASVVRNDKLVMPNKDQAIHALAIDLASQVSFSLLNATL
jgi:hypothetical protein